MVRAAANLVTRYGEKSFAYALVIYLLWRDYSVMSGFHDTLTNLRVAIDALRVTIGHQ